MQVLSKIELAGIRVEEIGKEIRAMASDGVIDQEELKSLLVRAHELTECADRVEDVALDLQVAARVMKHGREVAINAHTKRAIVDLAQVRAQREQRQQKAASGYEPNDAA